ncbi:MAG TPA: TetR/AcrR family transcriptional regulator, partial [Actinoallomurus sp.]|nr:TetR/AcrR family transcriptional regulator [Actinoallomurus sp.]
MPDRDIPVDLVEAALRAAERLSKNVADVPVQAIAEEAGISRSTLLRRIGGSRPALDAAVRATGVDPGGQRPVRERAIEAGAHLIGEHGLAALTLEAIATAAGCSVPSLYIAFGGRDELLLAIFERHLPLLSVEVPTDPRADLRETVNRIYRQLAEAVIRQPRVLPAMLAEALSRPGDPDLRRLLQHFAPRKRAGLGQWLADEMAAGRIRAQPLVLLIQQLIAPVVMHFVLRPAVEHVPG